MFCFLLLLRVQGDSPKVTLCSRLPNSSEVWSRTSVSSPPSLLFHPVELAMGNFVHFKYLLCAGNSFLSLFQTDIFPSTHILTTCVEDKSASHPELQHCVCVLPYRGHPFSVYGLSLLSTLTQQCNSHTDLFKMDWAYMKEISLSELLSGGLDGTK